MNKDLYELSAEITGVSKIITGLSNQLEAKTDSLTPLAMQDALFGVTSYLDRIALDLERTADASSVK